MTRLFRDQPIQVQPDPRTHEPRALKWHDRMHQVERVVGYHRVQTDWWTEEGEIARDQYRVITRDQQLLDVVYDLIEKRWYVVRQWD